MNTGRQETIFSQCVRAAEWIGSLEGLRKLTDVECLGKADRKREMNT